MYSTRIYNPGRSNAKEPHFSFHFQSLRKLEIARKQTNKADRKKIQKTSSNTGNFVLNPEAQRSLFAYSHIPGEVKLAIVDLFNSEDIKSQTGNKWRDLSQTQIFKRQAKKQTQKAKKPTRAERSITCKVQSHNDMNTLPLFHYCHKSQLRSRKT